ncbi:MAG: hypothetical protein ACI8YI_000119 [Paracoccaceae bacterium]
MIANIIFLIDRKFTYSEGSILAKLAWITLAVMPKPRHDRST